MSFGFFNDKEYFLDNNNNIYKHILFIINMRISEKITIILVTFSIFSLTLFSYSEILKPSYYSVSTVCSDDVEQFLIDNNLVIGGETIFYPNNDTVGVHISPFANQSVQRLNEVTKHEYCHVKQVNRFIFPLVGCNHQILKFFNEVECYTVQNYPDWLYSLFYKLPEQL